MSAILSLPLLANAVNLNCKDIVVDGQDYNLEKLGGPHSVHWIQEHPPSISNFTFTVDICQSLKPLKGVDKDDQCPQGTRGMCALRLSRFSQLPIHGVTMHTAASHRPCPSR